MSGHRPDQQHGRQSLRAPNGVLELVLPGDRPAAMGCGQYLRPTLVIGGDFDTWSFQEDREGLMRRSCMRR